MRALLSRVLLLGLCGWLASCGVAPLTNLDPTDSRAAEVPTHWLGTWSTAPQLTEPHNMPPAPGLANNTLRQVFKVSVGGDTIRMAFSNQYGKTPMTLNAVHLAPSAGEAAIARRKGVRLTFAGAGAVTLAPGERVMSDAVPFVLDPLATLAVTIHFGRTPEELTGHPGSRTTSYIQTGNALTEQDLSIAARTDHWYVISGLEVLAPETSGALAILGDSITDGRGSGTNRQNRWPDELARRLQVSADLQQVAVLNQGIGGGCLTRECLGPVGLERFARDVLEQRGVRWLIVMIGINDIGAQGNPGIAAELIAGYETLITQAHAAGIKVYGATLTPIVGSFYESPGSEAARRAVNEWIRSSGRFDGIIDMEAAVADAGEPVKFKPGLHDGDWLHPNEAGYRVMAEAVDLQLLVR